MPPKPRKPPPRKGSANRNLLIAAGAAAAVVVVLVGASLLLRGGDSGGDSATGGVTGIAEASALLDGIPQDRAELGSQKAKVTMIQFEDLQCPICRRYQAEGFPSVVDEYVRPGKVKLRFVGMAFIGPDSEKALSVHARRGRAGQALAVPGRAVREPGRGELRLGHGYPPRADRQGPRARLGEAQEGRRQRSDPPAGELDGGGGEPAADRGDADVLRPGR